MSDQPREKPRSSSRATLKNYFKKGSLPTEEHFRHLIDSMLNMEDEGFTKTEDDGLNLATKGDGGSVLGLRREGEAVAWHVGFGDRGDTLGFRHRTDESPALAIDAEGRVGIKTPDPQHELDVSGFVRMKGRLGVAPDVVDPPLEEDAEGGEGTEARVLADGEWHSILGPLNGCCVFEVVAGVGGKEGQGRYALAHALAMNTFNPRGWYFNPFGFNFLHRKNKIKVRHAYYRSRRDKLELQWHHTDGGYYLRLRTRQDYREQKGEQPPRIRYHVTNLWPFRDMGAATGSEPRVASPADSGVRGVAESGTAQLESPSDTGSSEG